MTKPAQNEVELTRLVRLLQRKNPLTVAKIAERLQCTIMTAHNRLNTLKKRGYKFKIFSVRTGSRGPESCAYMIR